MQPPHFGDFIDSSHSATQQAYTNTWPHSGPTLTWPYNGSTLTQPHNGPTLTWPSNGPTLTRPHNGPTLIRPYNRGVGSTEAGAAMATALSCP